MWLLRNGCMQAFVCTRRRNGAVRVRAVWSESVSDHVVLLLRPVCGWAPLISRRLLLSALRAQLISSMWYHPEESAGSSMFLVM